MTETTRSKFLGYPELLFPSNLPWFPYRSLVRPDESFRNCRYHRAFRYLAPGSSNTWHLAAAGDEEAGEDKGWVELTNLLVRFC